RLKLNLAGGVSQNDEPSQADSLGLRQERRKFTTSNASLGADWSVIGNVTASPYYRFLHFDDESGPQTTTQFAGGNISTSIYQIHTLTVGYEYVMSTTLHATTGASDSDLHGYAFRTLDARGPDAETNFQLWNVSLFDNYALPKLIEFRLSIGVSKLSTERDPFVSTSSSLAYWFGQAVATVAVVRGLSETFDGGQNQGVVKTTGATGSL